MELGWGLLERIYIADISTFSLSLSFFFFCLGGGAGLEGGR